MEENDSPEISDQSGSDILNTYLEKIEANEGVMPKLPKNFYEVTFEKPGGLVMPILVQYNYNDGTSEQIKYPAEIWRKNDKTVKKIIATDKEIVSLELDANASTADVETANNIWPKKESESEFDQFKSEANR